jgi:hypothetical protein
MATAEVTIDKILEAVRRLPAAQRKELVKQIEGLPQPEQALAVARRLRRKFRMEPKQRKRMADLLARGNAGTLTAEEKKELDGLVEEFEKKTLELAQAIAGVVNSSQEPRAGNGPASQ